jgi:hypothetical protein
VHWRRAQRACPRAAAPEPRPAPPPRAPAPRARSLVGEKLRSEQREGASRLMTTSLLAALAWGLAMLVTLQVRAALPRCRAGALLPWRPDPPGQPARPAPSTRPRAPQVCAEPLVRMTGANAALLPLSAAYLKTRALAQPAVMVIMISQAALIAQRDSLTPFLSVLLSTSVNLAGNLVFVAALGYGLEGAAGTTVATQYVGAAALASALMLRAQVRPPPGPWAAPLPLLPPRPRPPQQR